MQKGLLLMAISEPTAVFSIRDDKDQEIKQVMQLVYGALEEKGYNPVNQLVGYILELAVAVIHKDDDLRVCGAGGIGNFADGSQIKGVAL